MSDEGFEWDPDKAEANLRKHRIDFQAAQRVFDDVFAHLEYDASEDHGEDRWIAIGLVCGLLIAVVYTERGDRIRIISARKANSYEQRKYDRDKASF